MRSEQAIIEGLRQGDNDSFKYLFDLLYHPLCFTVSKMLRNVDEPPEDYVIYAYEKLYEKRLHFKTLGNVRSFLYTTATNKCMDFLRSKKCWRSILNEYARHIDCIYDPFASTSAREQLFDAVDIVLEELPVKTRRVAKLVYFSGMKTTAIADKLHLKRRSVIDYHSLALKELRKKVKHPELD